MTTTRLFSPITLRGLTIPNRLWMAPMCQYSAPAEGPLTGVPGEWHAQHYGARAVGGVGAIVVEATAVVPEGRITAWDLGLWNDDQVAGHRRLTDFMKERGVVPVVQLAHAGRKASTNREFLGGQPLDPATDRLGWEVVGPSAIAFDDVLPVPHDLSLAEIAGVVDAFAEASRRAVAAGYQMIEVHAAHGYLVHQFLSPQSNQRTDQYGGSLENRSRLAVEIADAVRAAVGEDSPVMFRLSATDWLEPEGWTTDQTVELTKALKEHGVDIVHVSTGGNTPWPGAATGPGYQVPFAARVREATGLPTVAVGNITEPAQAEQILVDGQADVVALGRPLLLDPYWGVRASRTLRADKDFPLQYSRAAKSLR